MLIIKTGNKTCVCTGIDVGRRDNGKKGDEVNFGYIEIEVHGSYSVGPCGRQLDNQIKIMVVEENAQKEFGGPA